MTEAETQAVERVLLRLHETVVALTLHRNEIDERISELKLEEEALARLLPPEKRLDRLFHH